MIGELMLNFEKVYGDKKGVQSYFAPGRVNLIGEHTDYNGGHVFPCALTLGTYAIARKREDKLVRVYSENFKELGIIEFNLEELSNIKEHNWANYPKGIIWAFNEEGIKINKGFDVFFFGNIPSGAGLSSSASIEIVTSIILKDLFNISIDMIKMAQLCRLAENKFIGVNCGIMDQFAIGMGKEGHAILLDTNTLDYTYAKLALKGAAIVIANTNKRRGLADSKYNERRTQCEEALKDLQEELNINSLGELNEQDFEKYSYLIKDSINIRRARHAVYENQRTIKAVKALEQNDIETFGLLMNASHVSLRDDYEVTGIELDTLVELAWQQEGVIGSRMTGAGFGGCTVSIVKNEFVQSFIHKVGNSYSKKIGFKADFYVVNIGDGAGKIEQ